MSQFDFTSAGSESRFTFQQDGGDNTGGGRFPDRLQDHDQWLVTRGKQPVVPSEGWQEPVNQLSFTEAQDRAEQHDGTVAFCFNESGPFAGFDLDDVKTDGEFTEEARMIVQRLGSYTEVSSSGTGLHVIVEGNHSDGHKHRGDFSEAGHLEVYDENRYFVLTGDVHDDRTSVESRPNSVREVQEDYLPKQQRFTFTSQPSYKPDQEFDRGNTDVIPEQVRRTIRACVNHSEWNVDPEVLRLWQGWDEGRDSPSEADMALVNQLYYWCKADQQLMDDCFRASGRMRQKWDEVHSADGATYGEITIREVCGSNSKTFGGSYVK